MAEKIKIKVNKNGSLSIIKFLRLIYTGEIDQFVRNHRVSEQPCFPIELRANDQLCYYCVDCYKHALSQVKENKDSYTVKKVKYLKADLEKGE